MRNAFRSLIQQAKDASLVGRLTRELMQVIKTDTTSARGLRTVTEGDSTLLHGFDFNIDAKLGATIFAPYSATIDRLTGADTVTLAKLYDVTPKTLRTWLQPHQDAIGKRIGRYCTILQVQIIFEKLGNFITTSTYLI